MSAITEKPTSPPLEPGADRPYQGGLLLRLIRWLVGLYHPRNLRERSLLWLISLNLVTLLVLLMAYCVYISQEPDLFNVRTAALNYAQGDSTRLQVPGFVTAATVATVAAILLDKSGGYIRNDVVPPFVLLDNMPSWEFGVIRELRDISRSLRDHLARAQTQSREDPDLQLFDARIHFNDNNWILPATEDEYRTGINALERYLARLALGEATFYVRADNLLVYLSTVEKRLGDYAQILSQGVAGQVFDDFPLAEGAAGPNAIAGTAAGSPTPWMQIDNVFYEARGYVWSLTHVLKAIEMDFHEMLATKNALYPLQRIIHMLESSQNTVYSPMIMNNTGFGILTNHSLVMASYISRANAALIELRILIDQG